VNAKVDTTARRRYDIAALPTVIVAEAGGKEIDRTLGFLTTKDFIETAENYQKGIGTLSAMLGEEKAKSKDASFAYNLGKKLFAHNRADEADTRFASAVTLDPTNTSGVADDALLERVSVSRKNKDWPGAVAHCRDLLLRWPDSDVADDATVSMGYYAALGGMNEEAEKAFKEYLRRWPNGEDAEFVKEQMKELAAKPAY
jgi:outer membrane protein assembly factor BamD (BamD/ComL family)